MVRYFTSLIAASLFNTGQGVRINGATGRRPDPMEPEYFHAHIMELIKLLDRGDATQKLPVEMTLSSWGWIGSEPVAIDYAEQVDDEPRRPGGRNFQRR